MVKYKSGSAESIVGANIVLVIVFFIWLILYFMYSESNTMVIFVGVVLLFYSIGLGIFNVANFVSDRLTDSKDVNNTIIAIPPSILGFMIITSFIR